MKVTIPRDYVKAGGYLKKVAESFFTPKLNTKATILEAKEQKKREGRIRDVEEATFAAALLGKMYWRGEGFKASEAEALFWFKKAAILVSSLYILYCCRALFVNLCQKKRSLTFSVLPACEIFLG